MSRPINILQLYPKDMNIYGDWGNVLVLKKRLEWHGYQPNICEYNVGDKLPSEIDIVVGGGGQDSGQDNVQHDLLNISANLYELADRKVPMLLICGMYQLFGHHFITTSGQKIPGIGLLDVETVAGPKRLIGNVVAESQDFGTIVGYENHSGQTTLGKSAIPLAQIRLGAGNNGQDGTEGARYKNVIGSYLHGSLLPKNPRLADWLIEQSVINRYGEFQAAKIDESITQEARTIAKNRPR